MSDRVITFAENQRSPAAAERDPFLDLVVRLRSEANSVADREPTLASAARKLEQDIPLQPGKAQERQTRVTAAYLLQDVEKLLGPINSVPPALRQEMERLAVTVPGLENERLKVMMAATPQIEDRELTSRIRRVANSTAQQVGDQNRSDVQESLRSLETSFASAAKAFEKAPEPAPANAQPDPQEAAAASKNKATTPDRSGTGLEKTASAPEPDLAASGGAAQSSRKQTVTTPQRRHRVQPVALACWRRRRPGSSMAFGTMSVSSAKLWVLCIEVREARNPLSTDRPAPWPTASNGTNKRFRNSAMKR